MPIAPPLLPSSDGSPSLAGPAARWGPLAPEHFEELALAKKRAATLTRALGIAKFNAWSFSIAGVLTLVMGLGDVETMVIGGLITVLGWNEFRGRTLLLAFDMKAPDVLGWNQVALMVLLVGYAAWKLLTLKAGANPYEEKIAAMPELGPMLEPFVKLYADISRWMYASMILIGVVYQGGNALYYFSRRKHLREFLEQTPEWVVKLQRTTRQ